MSFANKVILITGSSSGIGAHAAVTLAKKGASVVLVDLNEGRLKQVHDQIKNEMLRGKSFLRTVTYFVTKKN